MSRKEVNRPGLLKALVAGQLTNRQVAGALRLSVRHVQRLKRRWQAAGAAGLVHRARARPSRRRLAPELRDRVADLMRTVYRGLNDSHLTEKLREVEGLTLCRESVRRIRRALGLPAKQPRRPPRHRRRRLPEARAGSLMLLDASPADWLEGRGPRLTLHGALDDASGAVLALDVSPRRGSARLRGDLRPGLHDRGLPIACYGDGTTILVRSDPHWSLEEELRGAQDPTHLGRVLAELGIGYIRARSPQAKGRIERLWRTLQDRLTASSGCAASPRQRRPPRSSRSSSPTTIGVSPGPPPIPRRPGAGPRATSPGTSAVATRGRWPAITPCASARAGCSCPRGPAAARMPEGASSSGSVSTVGWSRSSRTACSPKVPPPARASSCSHARARTPRAGPSAARRGPPSGRRPRCPGPRRPRAGTSGIRAAPPLAHRPSRAANASANVPSPRTGDDMFTSQIP